MVASLILSAAATAGMLSGEASQSAGDGPTGDGGEVSSSDRKKLWKSAIDGPVGIIRLLNKAVSRATGVVGINLSIASILRQSQLFTQTVGLFFQIMGAFLDATLAPLMPLIFKGLSWMAEQLPKFGNFINNVAETIETIWNWLKTNWIWGVEKEPTGKPRPIYPTESQITETLGEEIANAITGPFGESEGLQGVMGNMLDFIMGGKRGKDLLFPPPSAPDPTGIGLTGAMLMSSNLERVNQATLSGTMIMRPSSLPSHVLRLYKQTSQNNNDLISAQKNSGNQSSLQVLSMMASQHN